jgi:hypothetical protein
MRTSLRILVLALGCTSLLAQDPVDDPFGHSRHGGEFDEGPRQAAYLMAGISDQVHIPVVGLSAEAQRFFDQGVCQQHGFWYFEAERSFRQVAKLQPECAMAYWGMAMANVENWKRGAGFAAQAVQRAAKLPEYEKLYVDSLAAYYQIDDALRTELQSGDAERIKKAKETITGKTERDEKQLHRTLVRGYETILAAFPDDIEAKAFLAVQVWRNSDVGIEISSHSAVDALLDAGVCQGADASDAPLSHPPVEWGEGRARAAFGGVDRGFGARDRARVAHVGPHLLQAEPQRRSRVAAGGQWPRRPRVHDARPRDAVRDPQLRPQPGMVVPQSVPHRPRAGSARSGQEHGRIASASREEQARGPRGDCRLRARSPRRCL